MMRLLYFARERQAPSMSKLLSLDEIEEKPKRPWATINVDEDSLYSEIVGGVIDAFDCEGYKEVERRVAVIYNNYPIKKRRVLVVGDENGRADFIRSIFGDEVGKFEGVSFASCFDTHKRTMNEKTVETRLYHHVFDSRKLTQQLIDEVELSQVTGSPITTLVTLWQDGHDKYIKMFAEALPGVEVLNICYLDPTGKGRSFARRFGTGDVRELFETKSELEADPTFRWVIEGIAHEGEVTWFLALPKQMKTWVMLCVVKALLTGEPLFGDERFKVPRKAKRVIYLIPETSRKPFVKRLKMLGLVEFIYDPITNPDGGLFVRTLSAGEKIKLTDPALMELARDADVFLDTAIRWLEGEENKSNDVAVLSENIFNLISAGARSVWCAHHAPKGFADASTMTLENMARGSGEYGAALTNAYGLLQEEEKTSTLRFHAIVGRDLDELIPDMILQGRPYLSTIGNFKVVDANAEPRTGKVGAPGDSLKQQKIDFLRTLSGSNQEKVEQLNMKFGTKHDRSIVSKWLPSFKGEATND
jgi:AAA domain-containing protein